jgi:hypothetical protein
LYVAVPGTVSGAKELSDEGWQLEVKSTQLRSRPDIYLWKILDQL